MSFIFSQISNRIKGSEIRELLKWTRKPGVISFGGGLPDPSLFPIQELIDITKDILTKKGYLALQYGPTPGEQEFIDAVITHMAAYGDKAGSDEICITSSSQQGLDLVSLLLLDADMPVVMELPSYIGGIQAFSRVGADMRGIRMDEEGMIIEELETTLDQLTRAGKKPRFIYTIPDFQNPSGITMSLERRKKLVAMAQDREIPIIEDSPYRELTFGASTLPSLWMLSEGKGVIMLKTLSKVLFPGMRLGWVVAEKALIEKMVVLKQSVDLCSPSYNQLIIAEFIKRGKMKETIDKAIACYKPKKDAMINALEANMTRDVSWSNPGGGMFLWVRLPEKLDSMAIFKSAVDSNVAYVIGRPFHCDHSGGNTLRLNYSFPSIEQIQKGIQYLGETIHKELNK